MLRNSYGPGEKSVMHGHPETVATLPDRLPFYSGSMAARQEKFFKVIAAFRDYYRLASITFKQLDKFLWLAGGEVAAKAKQPHVVLERRKLAPGILVLFHHWDAPNDATMEFIGCVVSHGRKWVTIRTKLHGQRLTLVARLS